MSSTWAVYNILILKHQSFLIAEFFVGYPEFSKELNNTGRPIVFSCSWPYYQEHIFKITVSKICMITY